jgi:hypothetical protein
MPNYMLMSYMPAEGGPTPRDFADPEDRRAAQARWKAFDAALEEAGAFVAKQALMQPHKAKTVRVRGEETQITDGPFAEVKEFLAGFYLIRAADLDEALKWAEQMPSSEYGPVEVRPVWAG